MRIPHDVKPLLVEQVGNQWRVVIAAKDWEKLTVRYAPDRLKKRSAKKGARELCALLNVNNERLSCRQRELLWEARHQVGRVALHVERFRESPRGDGPTGLTDDETWRFLAPAYQPPTYAEHQRAYEAVKCLIAKAAGTF